MVTAAQVTQMYLYDGTTTPSNKASDSVMDFEGAGVAGGDVIRVVISGVNYAALTITTVGSDTLIKTSIASGVDQTITLVGKTGLTSGDFAFV